MGALESRLEGILRASERFMGVLRSARRAIAQLPEESPWCIGGGAVRLTVFDALACEREGSALAPTPILDIDLVFFEADLERGEEIQKALTAQLPGICWDINNQAAMHLWHRAAYGTDVLMFTSLEEGITSWPETCTAVGVHLDAEDRMQVISPLPTGLEDLLAGRVRFNPQSAAPRAVYQERVQMKGWQRRWPFLIVEE